MSSKLPFLLQIKNGQDKTDWIEFKLEADAEDTVLDMLESLRGEGQAIPPYRHSCHHGSCGTCGAIIDGIPALMCLSKAKDLAKAHPRRIGAPAEEAKTDDSGRIIICLEPLTKMELIAGLAVKPGRLFIDLPKNTSYLTTVPDGTRSFLPAIPVNNIDIQTDQKSINKEAADKYKERQKLEACIECGLCVSSCPIQIPFIGPYALTAINIEIKKHPEKSKSMLEIADAADGVWPCDRHLNCSRVCPQLLYPAKHIQVLKNRITK